MKHLPTKLLLLATCVLLAAFTIKTNGLDIGDEAPTFQLKNVDEKIVSLSDYPEAKGFIVTFTCNHCPFAKAYEQRIIDLHNKYSKDYPVIAINANDAKSYPEDSFKGMQKRAKKMEYPFVYLHDETQATAKAYGASKTPEIYLLKKQEGKLIVKYIGAIDNNYEDASKADEKHIEQAITAIEKGEEPSPTKTRAVGCTIKWKK